MDIPSRDAVRELFLERILWSNGYFVCSISDEFAETIQYYIESKGCLTSLIRATPPKSSRFPRSIQDAKYLFATGAQTREKNTLKVDKVY